MAILTAAVLMDLTWRPDDRLQLLVGTEGAASLAASTPAGGTVLTERSPFASGQQKGGLGADPLGAAPLGWTSLGLGVGEGELGYGALGVNDLARPVLTGVYNPTDKSATLPIGVRIVDAQGNASSLSETVVQLADAPIGARDLVASDPGSPGSVRLTWTASPDV